MKTAFASTAFSVIQPQGSLNAATASIFQKQLNTPVLASENRTLLVDMQQVEFMDSAGLMTLVSTLKLARRLNRRLSLCSVLPSIRIILELTQLDGVFEIFADRAVFEAALA